MSSCTAKDFENEADPCPPSGRSFASSQPPSIRVLRPLDTSAASSSASEVPPRTMIAATSATSASGAAIAVQSRL
jgi:hypothetical protein